MYLQADMQCREYSLLICPSPGGIRIYVLILLCASCRDAQPHALCSEIRFLATAMSSQKDALSAESQLSARVLIRSRMSRQILASHGK